MTLSNGTIMDIPAGRAGFVPRMTELPNREWPRKMVLSNPRMNGSDEVDNIPPGLWISPEPKVPDCVRRSETSQSSDRRADDEG